MKKLCYLILIILFCFSIVGCSSNNYSNSSSNNSSLNSNSAPKSCNGWWEGDRCCNAYPSSYYNYNEPCPNNLVSGSEIPKMVNPNGCYTVTCR